MSHWWVVLFILFLLNATQLYLVLPEYSIQLPLALRLNGLIYYLIKLCDYNNELNRYKQVWEQTQSTTIHQERGSFLPGLPPATSFQPLGHPGHPPTGFAERQWGMLVNLVNRSSEIQWKELLKEIHTYSYVPDNWSEWNLCVKKILLSYFLFFWLTFSKDWLWFELVQ